MKPKKKVKKDVLGKLKVWLMHKKPITHNQAQKMWGTNRLAEFIRRLRRDQGMNISTEMKHFSDGYYGEYRLIVKKKVNRITSQSYRKVA